jgi:uncharacterized protein DUF2784
VIEAVVLLHLAFVLFVMLGGVLAIRWPWIMWLHVPAALWGVGVEFTGWICPLTPRENYLRQQSAGAGYQGDFIAQYILPVLYPTGLTRRSQVALGMFALAVNVGIYTFIVLRHQRLAAVERGVLR